MQEANSITAASRARHDSKSGARSTSSNNWLFSFSFSFFSIDRDCMRLVCVRVRAFMLMPKNKNLMKQQASQKIKKE